MNAQFLRDCAMQRQTAAIDPLVISKGNAHLPYCIAREKPARRSVGVSLRAMVYKRKNPMGGALRTTGADRVNSLNIGLMLISCVVALFIPFELFLFAYAVLGPAHYLTEISWLQKRRFFTPGKHDFWLLGGLAALVFVVVPSAQSYGRQELFKMAPYTFLALGSALVLVVASRTTPRILGLAAVLALSFLFVDTTGFLVVLLGLFVPTLVHVYLFTGFFMIYGALKDRSRSGYLAFLVFLLCPVVFLFISPHKFTPSAYVVTSYWKNFSILNLTLLGMDLPFTRTEGADAGMKVFLSDAGLIVMRFIAFAYTYHYLNWFSKTSIIRWHEVGVKRLVVIGALWLASVGLYIYDYSLGYRLLFCLSAMHIYLEFPLNHLSIIGTFREARSLIGKPLEPALAGAGKSRKG